MVKIKTKVTRSKSPSEFNEFNLTLFEEHVVYFDNQMYKQTERAPMRSPLSPIIASLFIDDFTTKALEIAEYQPKLWLRYVDDTFAIWTHGTEKFRG